MYWIQLVCIWVCVCVLVWLYEGLKADMWGGSSSCFALSDGVSPLIPRGKASEDLTLIRSHREVFPPGSDQGLQVNFIGWKVSDLPIAAPTLNSSRILYPSLPSKYRPLCMIIPLARVTALSLNLRASKTLHKHRLTNSRGASQFTVRTLESQMIVILFDFLFFFQ